MQVTKKTTVLFCARLAKANNKIIPLNMSQNKLQPLRYAAVGKSLDIFTVYGNLYLRKHEMGNRVSRLYHKNLDKLPTIQW